jgi:hypothetical protein
VNQAIEKTTSHSGRSVMAWSLVVISATIMFLFSDGRCAKSGEVTADHFRKMVQTELERHKSSNDSVGAPLMVTEFGEQARDFMIVPVLQGGKLILVYEDDPKRSWVTQIAGESVLRSVKLDLFSVAGARQFLQEKGFTGSADPMPVSFGPFSLFGVLKTGWYMATGSSFVLLSLEGRVVSETDIVRYWPNKVDVVKQLKARQTPVE